LVIITTTASIKYPWGRILISGTLPQAGDFRNLIRQFQHRNHNAIKEESIPRTKSAFEKNATIFPIFCCVIFAVLMNVLLFVCQILFLHRGACVISWSWELCSFFARSVVSYVSKIQINKMFICSNILFKNFLRINAYSLE
jgi:hypothetical protein